MSNLIENLERVNWIARKVSYEAVFRSVAFNNTIEKPLASVIIISWRLVNGLEENMSRLVSQRDTSYEIIFVNNGQPDEEFESIVPHVDTYVCLNSNTGAYVARNIGALFARAPVFIFLEDDGIIGDHFVRAHLGNYTKYDVIAVRGVCRPLTDNPLNKLARHYDLGSRAYAMFGNLEGNSSYQANAFFVCGGWSDDIRFGHGGPELSYRLTKAFPDQRRQIYSPDPVIYHDYARDGDHLKSKFEKQNASYEALKRKYPDWLGFFKSWRKYYRRRDMLIRKGKRSFGESIGDVAVYVVYGVIRPLYKRVLRR